MELREIRLICQEIVEQIRQSKNGCLYRRYDTFLEMFEMQSRKNSQVLAQIDRQLKKHGVTIWIGRDQVKSVNYFDCGETITFRMENTINKESNNCINENDNMDEKFSSEGSITVKIKTQEQSPLLKEDVRILSGRIKKMQLNN